MRQYPPILQDPRSRTLAAPYKEQPHHRSPSESIGNNYSPRACDLKIQHLHRRRSETHAAPSPGNASKTAGILLRGAGLVGFTPRNVLLFNVVEPNLTCYLI